jgi:hypothetical protein
MSRFYLASWARGESGFVPTGVSSEFAVIDLHPLGIPDQREGSNCLLWTPEPVVSPGALDLGDDLDGRMPRRVSRLLENRLGLTLDQNTRLRAVVAELLILHGRPAHDQTRWNPLRADRRGRHRIWLGGLVYDAPAPVLASITDDFNRASLGANWEAEDGGWTIASSVELAMSTNAAAWPAVVRYVGTDLDTDDHYAQVDFTFASITARWLGPAVRVHDTAETLYLAGTRGSDSLRFIQKIEAGGVTTLTQDNGGGGPTHTLRLDVDGSSLEMFFDGASALTATDTAITGNLKVGVAAHNTTTSRGDNFEAADLAAGTPGSVSPAAIARSFTVEAATPEGAAVTVPSAIARSVTVPAATVQGAAVAEPATVARSVTVPAVATAGAAVAEPAVTARSFTIPQASPATPVTVAPDTTITTVAVSQSTPQGLAAAIPAAIESSFTLPAVTVEGVGTVDPASIDLALTLPAVTPVSGGEPETVTPDAISLAYTTPAPSVSGGAVAEPSTLTVVADVEAALARVGAVVAPDAVARSFNLPAATAKVTGKVVASVIELAVVIGRAVKKIIHSPNPATAPLATSGSGVAPSVGSALGADLTVTGMSTATPNTGKSSAAGGPSGGEAD